jgi:rRNA maturation endonuclease Nob1
MVCRNICETLAKPAFEYNQYIEGKKYCRRCEVFLFYNGGLFCPCCGMQLRRTPTAKRGKERLGRKERKEKIKLI